MGNFMQPAGEAPAEKPDAQDASVSASRVGNGSVTADYNGIGVRPSSGAASTGCSDASDSIGARSRSDIAAPEDGRTPPRRSPAVADPVLQAPVKRQILTFKHPPLLRRSRNLGRGAWFFSGGWCLELFRVRPSATNPRR